MYILHGNHDQSRICVSSRIGFFVPIQNNDDNEQNMNNDDLW